MQYDYERFTPDRFQEFCQSLIVRSFPNTQCYPVGQKDGGRDALTIADGGVVFQVKFRRDRLKNDDPYSLLRTAVKGEVKKVKELADRGARKYIIATNLSASAALDSGAMDRFQKYLDDELPIPAQVWWRSDIDARLNNSYDIKWQFSEIITSSDLMRLLVEEGLGENARRRVLAMKGYMTAQYQQDEYVKFKQADLQASDLLSLFIDVPIAHRMLLWSDTSENRLTHVIREVVRDEVESNPTQNSATVSVGGASLLLHPMAHEKLRRVVIEGAPGQGKSTLAQYVCQTYRMKFLDKNERLERLPAKHRLVPVRLPMKVDLRDLSSWLQGRDPITEQEIPVATPRSLESFLAAQVYNSSGGQAFSVDDLNLFLSATPTIIFLDGLDEVASVPERKAVVDSVSVAAARLTSVAPNTQIVITSRPAAVANMPHFSAEEWDYLSLESITSDLIYEYTDRWSSARNISATDVDDIKRILRGKLKSAHIKDLARNAMQLTILLNLVHVRGQALPDHRTDLYDSYVEVFFNREAEKNKAVLENRQLLVDLHGMLAWTMHSSAENRHTNGRVTEPQLRELISSFLSSREYDPEILDNLWNGVVQRIVALVSRVEGTFEFEVQPLREYFAARHLYDTAPYSPVGRPRSGTKPDIFATIAPSPYWLNVTRFYAGCYSVGELAGLAEQVEEMVDPEAKGAYGSFPRAVATSLLADRVFSQAPRLTKRVATSVVDGLTTRYALQARFDSSNSVELRLPQDCGADVAAAVLMARTCNLASLAGRREAGLMWSWVTADESRFQQWFETRPGIQDDSEILRRWIESGSYGRTLKSLSDGDAKVIIETSEFAWLSLLAAGHRCATANVEDELRAAAAVADGKIDLFSTSEPNELIRTLTLFDSSFIMLGSELVPVPVPFDIEGGLPVDKSLSRMASDASKLVSNLSRSFPHRRNRKSEMEAIWGELIEIYERAIGRTWLSWVIANIAYEPSDEADAKGLYSDNSRDVTRPIEYIRAAYSMRSDKKWWLQTFADAGNGLEKRVTILLFVRYSTPAALLANLDALNEALSGLVDYQFASILREASRIRGSRIPRPKFMELMQSNASSRAMALLFPRFNVAEQSSFSRHVDDSALAGSVGFSDAMISVLMRKKIPATDLDGWMAHVGEISRLYRHCREPLVGNIIGEMRQSIKMPVEVAGHVLGDSDLYPTGLISIADQSIAIDQVRMTTSVGVIARKQKWSANSEV
ncbi:NACHT domain-containing protein [Rhodococcus qingshengii]|uniref:NACHT domain-containing protein n=1 Tax=Rhodococcus qingshengii TaxID=334542 RepID=UPI0039C24239